MTSTTDWPAAIAAAYDAGEMVWWDDEAQRWRASGDEARAAAAREQTARTALPAAPRPVRPPRPQSPGAQSGEGGGEGRSGRSVGNVIPRAVEDVQHILEAVGARRITVTTPASLVAKHAPRLPEERGQPVRLAPRGTPLETTEGIAS